MSSLCVYMNILTSEPAIVAVYSYTAVVLGALEYPIPSSMPSVYLLQIQCSRSSWMTRYPSRRGHCYLVVSAYFSLGISSGHRWRFRRCKSDLQRSASISGLATKHLSNNIGRLGGIADFDSALIQCLNRRPDDDIRDRIRRSRVRLRADRRTSGGRELEVAPLVEDYD
jgi:hypothetical protein